MTLEAVKALFGQLPPYNPSVMTGATVQSPQEELVSNRMRIRAWSMVASQVPHLTFTTVAVWNPRLKLNTEVTLAALLFVCQFEFCFLAGVQIEAVQGSMHDGDTAP